MKPETGLALRLAGPLVQAVCVAVLLASGGRGWRIGRVPLEYPLYAGFGVGFLMVLAGLTVTRLTAKRPRDRSPRHPPSPGPQPP